MNRDQLRVLAGLPTSNDPKGRQTIIAEAPKHAAIDKDGHFDIAVEDESTVGRLAVALAKENLPVDITYAMDVFYFNFKSSKLHDQAEKIASSFAKRVKEAITPASDDEHKAGHDSEEDRKQFWDEAHNKVHGVYSQWHYEPLEKAGFVPQNKEAKGLVRSYTYKHPSGHTIIASTGVHQDHWSDLTTKKSGLWSDLEPHLNSLNLNKE